MDNLNLVSVEEIITGVYSRIDSVDPRDELIFRDWIWDALREIGTGIFDVETECIAVENLRICKPCYFGSLLELNIQDQCGNALYYQMSYNTKESEKRAYMVVTEDENAFHLSSGGCADVAHKAEVTFYRLPIDENNDPLVREDYKLAIICYLEYQYWKRERNRGRASMNQNPVPMGEVDMYDRKWLMELTKVKGRVKSPSPVHAETIMRKWVTLIPNFQEKGRHRVGYPRRNYRRR